MIYTSVIETGPLKPGGRVDVVPPPSPYAGSLSMALSSAQRDAIRAEYQNGAFVRALARSHGVHESSIREMASKHGWTRDPQATERIRQANQPKGLDGIAGRYFPRRPTHWRPVPRYMSYWHEAMPPAVVERLESTRIAVERYEAEARAEIDRVAERARAEIDELVMKDKADAVAKANADDLARAEKLDQIFNSYATCSRKPCSSRRTRPARRGRPPPWQPCYPPAVTACRPSSCKSASWRCRSRPSAAEHSGSTSRLRSRRRLARPSNPRPTRPRSSI